MEGPSPIRWGAYREGARSQLRRFHSLKREGPALIQAYQDVLDKDETFTQFFSDDRLQSYELESKLRKLLGIRPPLVDEPESPNNQNDASLSWATIIRDGKFEERDDGFFQCRMQGRLIKIDEAMHRTIMVNRCLNPPDKDPWVSAADVKKEYEVNLSIEADVLDELRVQTKYVERLKRLHQSLKKRRYRLQGDQGPAALSSKRSRTPHTLRSKNSSPIDSSLKLSVVSHTAGDSQPESRMSISTEPPGGLMKPTASIETTDARGHSASPSSSDVSTGEDIPFSRDQNSLKRKNLSSDYEETLDEDWPTQHQTPVPRDTSTPLISASKRNKSAAAEEGNKMIDSVGAAAKSRTSVPSNTSTPLASVPRSSEQSAPENSHTIFDGASERNDFPIRWLSEAPSALYSEAPSPLYPDNDEMEIDKQTQSPKPMAPTQRAKQPTPKHETPRKSKRALNGAASSLRQEYENAGQLIDLTSSPASNPASVQEAMQLGLEMAGWQGDFTPVDLRPKAASTKTKTKSRVKEQKKGTRVRNNFTQEECDHAPAWLKPRLAAGISPAQLEQDYEARFGVLHRYNTLKHWLERQEAKSGTILSKIVVFKISTLFLESFE
ncbi:hypothetical protein N7508_001951 [Penicillium antarcticum]|uniref:uncharacterized protein n=1 Tax=Penicillium antarcticum TaxID=416450 RepID=UPI0023846DEB|nr:uncharacterized protein N7508_001951 [Penicillium antarcticum]KAJ5317443.1 hypothetical protein N7508_001951 [Penicillium antarcticum]